ncbi:MAG TPA: poly-gamma-glutamate hydrolase family protein [Steroidobacteraceae bacterium]|nr:poly-gamma-glutamate hydrolase family protein [Steroidobacteraceae bacterium]
MAVGMQDKYTSFAALEAGGEIAGRDYNTMVRKRPQSGVLIVAPHGGNIEIGTTELADLIAGTEYSLFAFNGLKIRGRNRDLHITSHNFDHPECVALAAHHPIVLAVHGCKGDSSQIYVGGLDDELATLLTERLIAAGLPATATGHKYPGRNPLNICNRGARARGAQLEFTLDLREEPSSRANIAPIVRGAVMEFVRFSGLP